MRTAGLLAASAALAAAAPVAAEEWRLFHRESDRRGSEIGYADVASIQRSATTVRLTVRGFATRAGPPGPASVAMRLEMDCKGRRVRPLEARPLDAEDRLTHEIRIDRTDFQPLASPAMQALARLVCDGDRSGTEAIPAGTNLNSHAAAVLAAMRAPPPEPPPLSAEEAERLAAWAKENKRQRFEGVIRAALAEQCGSDLRCRHLEARIQRGVEPVVAVEDVRCEESLRGSFGRATCAFLVRHPRTQRRLSCTVELAEAVGHHSRYWTYRTRPSPPPPPPSPSAARLPAMPPSGESSLLCSGSLAGLVSE